MSEGGGEKREGELNEEMQRDYDSKAVSVLPPTSPATTENVPPPLALPPCRLAVA